MKVFSEKTGGSLAGKPFLFCCSTSRKLNSACFACKFISSLNVSWVDDSR